MEKPGHVIPQTTLLSTYMGLIFLTAIMVGISRIDVGRLGMDWIDLHAIKAFVIMSIALVMGVLVAMFLMGLRYEHKLLNLTVFISNFVFLLIFVLFTWADTGFRGEVDPAFNQKINVLSPVKPETGAEAAGEHAAAKPEAPAPAPVPVAAPVPAPPPSPGGQYRSPGAPAPVGAEAAPASPAAPGTIPAESQKAPVRTAP